MLLNIIKILTALSFSCIPWYGEHIGGPLIMLLFIGVSNGSATAFLILAGLIIIVLSTLTRNYYVNKILIPIILILLVVALFADGGRLVRSSPVMIILFMTLSGLLIVLTFIKKETR